MPTPSTPPDRESLDLMEYRSLVPIYESALEANPEDLPTIYWLGHAYTRLGRHEEGLKMDLLLTRLMPDDGTARYNLCCSFALLGRKEEAYEALEQAIRLGYADPGHMRRDEDLASIRDDARFREILERLERS